MTAEFISATTLRVSWNPPSDGDTVTGYILRYTDRATGQREAIRLDGSTLSSDVNCDSENITVQTQYLNHLPSSEATVEIILRKCINFSVSVLRFDSSAQRETVTIHPVNATAVSISWSGSPYLSTSLQYTSYFIATGSVMSQYETVLTPDVTSL